MTNLTSHVNSNIRNATPMDTCPVSFDRRIERSETPPILRAAGIRLPHDQAPMTLNELQELLGVDIGSTTDTYIDDMTDLLSENGGIFPNSSLPFPPTVQLLRKLSFYDPSLGKCIIPDTPRSETKLTEKSITDFLNNICKDISKIEGKPQIREWNSNYCNSPLEGSPISRKPDIVLVDIMRFSPITWSSVRSIAEVTTQDHEPKRICNTVTDKTYIILTTQPDRVFVPILSFWGIASNFSVRLTVTDRQGQLRSQVLKLGLQWRQADCLNFLRLLIGLCFAIKPTVGYDPTMTTVCDKVTSILCDGKQFNVIKSIFESQSLVGHATRVWEVEYENRKYILKDAWVETSRSKPEYVLLAELQGINGVPHFFCGGDVCLDGKTLSTGSIRNNNWGDQRRVRVRRRTVTSSIGAHIATFSSKRELISAFRDIVISMYLLLFESL
jgi:hypothetical protein